MLLGPAVYTYAIKLYRQTKRMHTSSRLVDSWKGKEMGCVSTTVSCIRNIFWSNLKQIWQNVN